MQMEPGRVIVGVGRSLGAYQALRFAVAEARRREAPLLAVRTFRTIANDQILLPTNYLSAGAIWHVDTAFAEALGGLPGDLTVMIIVQEGDVAHALVATADRESDLLVIGGHCGHRLIRLRGAAIARSCTRYATCPVVIVPPATLARSAHADRLARQTLRGAEEYLSSRCNWH
jgi:nucleotide-binding universal stress UspA family protein